MLAQLVHRSGGEARIGSMTPSCKSRCDLGEPIWLSFISCRVSAMRPAIWSSCRDPACSIAHHAQEIVGRRIAVQHRRLLFDRLEHRQELGPLGPLTDQDLVKELIGRDDLEREHARPAGLGAAGAAVVGLGHEPKHRADLGRIGLQEHVVPDLMIQNRARGLSGKRKRDRGPLGLRLDLVFLFDGQRAVDLQAEGRQPEIVGRADRERNRGDRRDAAADADGAQGDPRLAVAQEAERQERRAARTRPVSADVEQDLERRRLAERPLGRERPVVHALEPGGLPGWTFNWMSASFSLPTSVNSTSVSGRKSRCWSGVVDVRQPSPAVPGSLTRRRVSASEGRSTRSTVIGPSQSSPPVKLEGRR